MLWVILNPLNIMSNFHLEIDKFISNGRIDVRKEVLITYISLNGDVSETEKAILKIADDYKYEDNDDIYNVYLEFIAALNELV